MGPLQLKQLRHRLETDLIPHIDQTDLSKHQGQSLERHVLSRALAAFAVQRLWDLTPEDAAATVTDAEKDQGIDAIAVDPLGPRILIVQSKWSDAGNGSAAKSEMTAFRDGVNLLMEGQWDKFADTIASRRSELEPALVDTNVKIELVFAHSGTGELASEVEEVITPLVDTMNEFNDDAPHQFRYLGQRQLYKLLSSGQGNDISVSVNLSDWGVIEEPVRAFYGHVACTDLAGWYHDHGDALFSSNLRATLPDSSVNDGIEKTLTSTPEHFWYFNNGVTVLCNKVAKAPMGDRRAGVFDFDGIQVVNGAQTVGSIAQAFPAGATGADSSARVMVRFIELRDTEPEFGSSVTRLTNTQNRIGGREFAALDPEQTRIAHEFDLDGRKYVFRSGEPLPAEADGTGIYEATNALACLQNDVRHAVQAKREVSRFWADVEKQPYTLLFNGSTTSIRVWRAVRIMRIVDEKTSAAASSESGKRQLFLIHLNRFAVWLVNHRLQLAKTIDDPNVDWDKVEQQAAATADEVIRVLPSAADDVYAGYAANLAKNASKCALVAEAVERALAPPGGDASS